MLKIKCCEQCLNNRYICHECFEKENGNAHLDLQIIGTYKCRVCKKSFDGKDLYLG